MDALYATIWIALILFAIGDASRSVLQRPPAWAWWSFAAGLALAIVHTLLAFHVVHQWSHADAVLSTARQTETVYGTAVGWGVYVNYVFLGVWLGDAWSWRQSGGARPAAVTWTLRAFYMLIIANAAVVFATGPRRVLGLSIVAALAGAWALAIRAPSSPLR